MKKILFAFGMLIFLNGCGTLSYTKQEGVKSLYNTACTGNLKSSNSPWHISNLYNCSDKTIFIPYQLWTGMDWDGNKDASCMHKADSYFTVGKNSHTHIYGPKDYKGVQVWHRDKTNGSKQQYFACNKLGIGRMYDSRKPDREYLDGRCKFPAGYGWRIGTERECTNTSVIITNIEFDGSKNLSAIEFEWRTNGYHDHTYRYEVGYGMRNGWKQ